MERSVRVLRRTDSSLKQLLKVQVLAAQNLTLKEKAAYNPYFSVSLEEQKFKTSIQKKTANPEWKGEETFLL